MSKARKVDPAAVLADVVLVAGWLDSDEHPKPDRATLAAAVRGTVALAAASAPGRAVEVRVPPFAAAQLIDGPTHTRGTPPNVVETDARTWLLLATGRLAWADALAEGSLSASGTRAGELAALLPVVR